MFRGSMVAMVTPMREDGAVDDDALARLVEFHVDAGTDAIIAVGTTGESATLDHEEHREEPRSVSAPASSGELRQVEPQPLKVASDGRVLIPLEMREAMVLGEDGRVTARVEAGELRLVSPAVAVRQIQARMRKFKKPGESIVDQFLTERRALWGEE